jgi:hypothetical protein
VRIAVIARSAIVKAIIMTARPPAVMRTPGAPSMSAGWARASARAAIVARPATSRHRRGDGAPAEDRGDRAERDLEHVVEHERHSFRRGEGVYDDV